MEPKTYVEKPTEVEAIQWDGTDEAADWILTQFDGRATRVDDATGPQIQIEGPVHPFLLDRDVWVMASVTVYPTWMTDETFRTTYIEKQE